MLFRVIALECRHPAADDDNEIGAQTDGVRQVKAEEKIHDAPPYRGRGDDTALRLSGGLAVMMKNEKSRLICWRLLLCIRDHPDQFGNRRFRSSSTALLSSSLSLDHANAIATAPRGGGTKSSLIVRSHRLAVDTETPTSLARAACDSSASTRTAGRSTMRSGCFLAFIAHSHARLNSRSANRDARPVICLSLRTSS